MRIKQFFAAFVIFYVFIGIAQANSPESGWWWNASEGGRGYSIEIQDNQVFFAAYSYDSNKQPVWYYSSGTLTGDSFYSGRVVKAVNGSCFGCAEGTPQSIDIGSMSISFNGEKDATLNILGFTTQITRFDFANGDNTHYPNACYGEWSGVTGSPSYPVYSGERITLNATFTGSDGKSYLKGARTGTSNLALCSYDPATKYWSILLDSSALYYQFFFFKFTGFNKMEGTHWTFIKGGSLSGAGESWVAFRTASKNYVQGGNGPRTAKSMRPDPIAVKTTTDLRLLTDKSMADLNNQRTPVSPAIQDVLSKNIQAISAIQK